MTGALDANRVPLVFELVGVNAIGLADQIVAAIRPLVVTPTRVTLKAVGNDAGFGFSFTPADVLATVYHFLGIDPEQTFNDFTGRPVPIIDGGQAIREII